MEEVIVQGAHISALEEEAIEVLAKEVAAKVKQNQCRVVLWDNVRDKPPEQLEVSPTTMIPHKSRKFRTILDLLLLLGF